MASSPSSPEISSANGPETHTEFSYKDATAEEIMEDLTSRFILNLPDNELTSLERVCFQVEQAHWFYEDFIREENRRVPSVPLKKFTEMIFQACPVLQHWHHEDAFQKFMQYKTLVPVCGAIMLNETWDKCVLVKGWKSSSGWGFPKGKINETEPKSLCAIREVLEETGYNLAGKINPEHCIETTNNGQRVTLFIVPGVPEDYPFRTKTRKEISKIEWFKLTDLPAWKRNKQTPGKFYLIAPFIHPLKTFVNANKPRKSNRKIPPTPKSQPSQAQPVESAPESDTLQDSSSQSSSLDNGGPQTPSPQYSESQPAFVPQIAGEETPVRQELLATESLDPHFARLLSGLTMSLGAPKEPEKQVEKPNLLQAILASASPQPPGAAPVEPKEAPPAPRPDPPPAPVSHTSPGSVGPVNNTTVANVPETKIDVPSPTAVPPIASNTIPIPRPPSKNHLSPTQRCFASASPKPSISPRSPTFRKSTADISPYLTRATEVPVSAKRLQQLALLESVANESARMTPKLREQVPYAHGGPPSFPPLPDTRFVPSYPHAGRDPRSMQYANPPLSQANDPFIVRSRTSQAMHRVPFHSPPGSASMNHNQLLSLINGSGSRPGVAPPPPPPAPAPQPFSSSPSFTPAPAATYPMAGPPNPGMYPVGPGGWPPYYHRQVDSYPAPPQHPIPGPRPFTTVQGGPPPNASAGALLSILNSSLPPSADPQFTRA